VARWTYYTDGGYDGNDFSFIGMNENDLKSSHISRAAFTHGLHATIQAYQKIGVEVIIVPQIPQQRSEPLDIYAQSLLNELSLEQSSITVEDHFALQSFVINLFESANVTLYDFTSTLCNDVFCSIGTSEQSYYFDDDHLTLSGSKLLTEPLIRYLAADE
jgi:hypothetical protein